MKTLENYNVPEKREDRVKKLNNAIQTLKTEFVGLDGIIDNIKQSISPWYITPEIIKRPVVISVWGMTGTGKTSLVKRLVDLLGLAGKTMFFDCGLESNDSNGSNISDKINDNFCSDDEDSGDDRMRSDFVFVFDEFQYARTIDEAGCEEIKSSLRPIWNIIDDGELNLNTFRYGINYFRDFLEDFSTFIEESELNYNIKVTNGKVYGEEDKKRLKDDFGLIYFCDNDFPEEIDIEEGEDEKKKVNKPLNVFNDRVLRVILRKLNSYKSRFGTDLVKRIRSEERCLGEWIEEFKKYSKVILSPKVVKCNKSLIFILGNLDEAFMVEKEINPDFDADVFYNITSKVTISDIKEALKKRFRAEQIARFGNNLIKYPTLKREHFERIIKKELDSIFTNFKEGDGIEVKYGEDIIKLVYSESVYPVQGVRPVFTTIGSMITPLLSDILLEKGDSTFVELTLENIDVWKEYDFKLPEVILLLKYSNGKETKKSIRLQLGELRDPTTKRTRYITSVHESGHAILFAFCKGIAPINIVSISTDNGGFCSTYDAERDRDIYCKKDVQNDVMISLAGYEAERLMYKGKEDKCLMGSSSDIESAWRIMSSSAYSSGYFDPYSFANRDTEIGYTGIPQGISDTTSLSAGEFGKISSNIQSRIIDEFMKLRAETKNILLSEKKLLKELSIYLGQRGSIKSDKFLEFVKKYGNKLTLDYMKSVREEDENFYYNRLIIEE